MIVAGDHANNDMAGDEEGAWKTAFEDAGYEVITIVEGLGQLRSDPGLAGTARTGCSGKIRLIISNSFLSLSFCFFILLVLNGCGFSGRTPFRMSREHFFAKEDAVFSRKPR